MSASVSALKAELSATNIHDLTAVRALAVRVDALTDPADVREMCSQSRALRAALSRHRADLLSAMLARNERTEFLRRTADSEYMTYVDLDALRIPRFLSLHPHTCGCGASLLIPFDAQGGPRFSFECPLCSSPFVGRPAYQSGAHALHIEEDLRPAKKRRRELSR